MKDQGKPIIVGITGGIGSGKTTIAKYFETLGIPVYYADIEAKALMNSSKVIKRKLIALFGSKAYDGKGLLNRDHIRQQIFYDKSLLTQMNAVVHPKVGAHFKKWLKKQNAPYILKEAAVIFENNLESQYDYIITVIADKDERIRRVMQRDNISKAAIEAIIANQLSDQEKIEKSHFVIHNTDLAIAKAEALQIHKSLTTEIFKKKF